MTRPRLDNQRRRLLLAAGAALVPLGLGACGSGGSSAPAATPTPTPTPRPSTMTLGRAIVVDQFGYLPAYEKVAVVRDPQTGFDAADAFAPGTVYEVVNASTNAVVHSGSLNAWKDGATDTSSGDKAWHFDFSIVTAPGEYFIRDAQREVKSASFKIGADVYLPVLRAAVRTFFYQRAGHVKLAQHAGAAWADGASHIGPGQDKNARLFSAPNDVTTERDLSGAWYDAGDYNKYTSWTAGYIVDLLHAYIENPGLWTDDFNIPESGNGVPDLLDEVKWGMDFLCRMQEANGSVLSIVGLAGASPPSAATGASYYGPATTNATSASAAAYALGAKVFGTLPAFASYAADLRSRAERAWTWAEANPNVLFRNNDAGYNSQGLGAGQQETTDYGRFSSRMAAAIYLFDLTGKAAYGSVIDVNYGKTHLIEWGWISPYEPGLNQALLYYASLASANAATAGALKTTFAYGLSAGHLWGAVNGKTDPYKAYIPDYVWGSNAIKLHVGNVFALAALYGIGTHTAAQSMAAASHYIHYLHGVNPLGKVYLSNMGGLGAEESVDQFYHTWFANGSVRWDSVKTSTYGPAPGFLVGGPNSSYNWESRCPGIHSACGAQAPSPPTGQPAQKSYKDFNDSWPLNSWSVTENSNGYQTAYIRLLARFVK